jgi:radical SAM superfamily enzyme YgiQ (UPF0313 family)|tara:strand:- start:2048 stop:3544 length:1497 start_codon:yes stop_codon:yes gene_type:complete
MKIAISYPPIINDIGQRAMISQNRNVQYFKKPTFLIPVVHAQAASILKEKGHDVIWDDGNSDMKSFDQWLDDIVKINPEVIVFESTTPIMHFMWDVTKQLKLKLKNVIIVMTGYHSMRSPQETLLKSETDIVLKSNHVDFLLLKLCNSLNLNKNLNELSLDGLTVKKSDGSISDYGKFKLVEDLDRSAMINRELINWKNYAYENGNFLRTPGTYASSVIRDCSFGKCTFCRYNGPDLTFSAMSIKKSVDEYEDLILNHGVKEIFDDSGVWYRGKDAITFAKEIIKRNLHTKGCYFGINTRFEYLDEESIKWMAKANFRFVLIGLESGSNYSLNKLDKGYTAKGILQNLKMMTKYGLHPHLTIMVGYYWETKEMLRETVELSKFLMFKGYARTLQVTLCTPLDFTPYHLQTIQNKILLANDYNDHDMSKLIVKTPEDHKVYYNAVREIYSIAFHPKFLLRQFIFLLKFRIRDWEFLFTYSIRAVRRVRQHMFNLTHKNS